MQHEAAAKSRTEAEAESSRITAEVAQLRGALQAEQDELSAAKAEFAAMHERLGLAEAMAKRLEEERVDLERRELALRQHEEAIREETAAMARQSAALTPQLSV